MWRRVRLVAVTAMVVTALPIIAAAIGISQTTQDVYTPPPQIVPTSGAVTRPAARVDASKPTAVIVLGEEGANVADTLAPFEVFATTGQFNVLTVAANRDPVPLTGGLDLVPDLTFDELDARLSKPADVIVVPQLPGDTSAVRRWLVDQHQQGASLIMSVCVGAEVLADAGLLDGRPATSHWLKLLGLRRSDKQVNWTQGVRFVDDGDIITTAGVLSGIDGAIRAVERIRGTDVATHVARQLGWQGYSPGKTVRIGRATPAPADIVAVLSAGYRWRPQEAGVLLTDGVGEIELASAFRPYTELSYLARLTALTSDGQPIDSRHGLRFVPRGSLHGAAADLDRILVPGADAAQAAATDPSDTGGVPVDYLHAEPGFAFDSVLEDISSTYDNATARWVGKSLQYPTENLELRGSRWPWRLSFVPVLLAMAGGTIVVLVRMAVRRRPAAKRLKGRGTQ